MTDIIDWYMIVVASSMLLCIIIIVANNSYFLSFLAFLYNRAFHAYSTHRHANFIITCTQYMYSSLSQVQLQHGTPYLTILSTLHLVLHLSVHYNESLITTNALSFSATIRPLQ